MNGSPSSILYLKGAYLTNGKRENNEDNYKSSSRKEAAKSKPVLYRKSIKELLTEGMGMYFHILGPEEALEFQHKSSLVL